MKYAHLENNTNKILGWYDDSIHSEIPTPNIEVTDEVWQEAININANAYENGKFSNNVSHNFSNISVILYFFFRGKDCT